MFNSISASVGCVVWSCPCLFFWCVAYPLPKRHTNRIYGGHEDLPNCKAILETIKCLPVLKWTSEIENLYPVQEQSLDPSLCMRGMSYNMGKFYSRILTSLKTSPYILGYHLKKREILLKNFDLTLARDKSPKFTGPSPLRSRGRVP